RFPFFPLPLPESCPPFRATLLVRLPPTSRIGWNGKEKGTGRTPPFHYPSTIAGQGGRGVASQWRIRHKLLLGLASVVGVLALLLLGTLEGLASYRSTMNTVDSKLQELREAQQLQVAVTEPAAPIDGDPRPLSHPHN